MTFRQYARALRRRAWLLVLLPLAATVAAAIVTQQIPPTYESDVTVLVHPAQPISSLDPSGAAVTADQVSRTYAQLMTQRPLLEQVVKDLHLGTTSERLGASIKVTPQANTTVLTVTVENRSATEARDIANKLVEDFIAQTKKIQQAQVDQYTAKIESQLDQLRKQIQSEQGRIDQLQAKLNEQPQAQVRTQPSPSPAPRGLTADEQTELNNLQQQITLDRAQYATIVTNESNVEVNVARAADSVVVVAPAVAPSSPASPKLWLDALVAAVAGLILAIGLVVLLEHLDQSITTDEQLVERTGLLPLAYVPMGSGKRPQRDLVAVHDEPQLAEPYRTLRTNILFSTVDRSPKTITISSAVPREGKSRTAANLAAALAATGRRTLLVDCDFRRPAQHRIFGRVRNVGLSDLILRQAGEPDVVIPVEQVPNLWVLTSGPTPPNPSELLGSARMRDVFRQLADQFEHIVIDSPPVNLVADGLVLASYTDVTLLVVEYGRSRYPAVRHAREALERVGARVLGAVLNKVPPREGYGYYSYSSNGHAAKPAEPAESAAIPALTGLIREPPK